MGSSNCGGGGDDDDGNKVGDVFKHNDDLPQLGKPAACLLLLLMVHSACPYRSVVMKTKVISLLPTLPVQWAHNRNPVQHRPLSMHSTSDRKANNLRSHWLPFPASRAGNILSSSLLRSLPIVRIGFVQLIINLIEG